MTEIELKFGIKGKFYIYDKDMNKLNEFDNTIQWTAKDYLQNTFPKYRTNSFNFPTWLIENPKLYLGDDTTTSSERDAEGPDSWDWNYNVVLNQTAWPFSGEMQQYNQDDQSASVRFWVDSPWDYEEIWVLDDIKKVWVSRTNQSFNVPSEWAWIIYEISYDTLKPTWWWQFQSIGDTNEDEWSNRIYRSLLWAEKDFEEDQWIVAIWIGNWWDDINPLDKELQNLLHKNETSEQESFTDRSNNGKTIRYRETRVYFTDVDVWDYKEIWIYYWQKNNLCLRQKKEFSVDDSPNSVTVKFRMFFD